MKFIFYNQRIILNFSRSSWGLCNARLFVRNPSEIILIKSIGLEWMNGFSHVARFDGMPIGIGGLSGKAHASHGG